ncbi:MAG: type II toxin-antitoxin system VapC family toxin [Wenzhouxiangella sp.]|nr:type II toxin-antitoxin system VapC family toxin [Wenzhouxiangella sp.]
MVLLDTNVLSECMRSAPHASVVAWLDAQPVDQLWISAVTHAEIELGIALLPEGRRQQDLRRRAQAVFEEDFLDRCLPFDDVAARHYGRIVASRMRAGHPISVEDAQIASVALSHGLTLATRNVKDFAGIDSLAIINPWV